MLIASSIIKENSLNIDMLLKLHRQKITILFSVIFLFSIIIIGFHHHDDASRHSDCPVCIAGDVYSFTGSQVYGGLTIKHVVSYLYLFSKITHIQRPIFPTFAYRAPPFTIPS